MIIAIGYSVRKNIGTNFRKWATTTLEEYNAFSKRILTNPTEKEKLYFDKLQELMLIDKKD